LSPTFSTVPADEIKYLVSGAFETSADEVEIIPQQTMGRRRGRN
jgi:hypothetical protein